MVKEMVEILFPATRDIDEVVGIIEKYRGKFGLNTGLRLAMFLAQVREETGNELKVIRENLNYSEEALPKLYKAFNDRLADKYGRNEEHKANQEAIANIAYANKLGNGNADSDGDGDMDANDDGYKYRGAGCLQITGKGNFAEVQKRIVAKTGAEANPDTMEGFLLFGMAYWLQHDLYRLADRGTDLSVVDAITAKINKYTTSYEERRKHFLSIKHLVSV